MNSTTILVLLIVALVASWLMLPRLMIMRTIPSIIRIFRQHNAVGVKTAKTMLDMGFKPRSFVENMFQLRDYKPVALQILMQANVIKTTDDGKLYLSEESLAMTRWRELK